MTGFEDIRAATARAALGAALAPRAGRFAAALADPARAQERLRRRLVAGIATTDYGRAHGITGAEGYQEFRDRLPAVGFEALRPWVDRQMATRAPVLAPGPVRLYEPTSGSSGASKLIPYTDSLLEDFNELFLLWAGDLVRHGPRFTSGRMFFSMSPPCHERAWTASGAPVGLEDDAQYLSPWTRRIFGGCFVFPPGLKGIRDPFLFKLVLAAALVAEPHLEILSIWHPTYLIALLDFLRDHAGLLASSFAHGEILHRAGSVPLAPVTKDRLAQLRSSRLEWASLWPDLKLISCWTDAGAARFARDLAREFPSVLQQGKGLLATEAPLTVPRLGAPAPVPLLHRVFFEFEDENGGLFLLHQLAEGQRYEVIVTQSAGLARYRLGDRVEVTGLHGRTPCLRFVGRGHDTSDLVGEKLAEEFVRRALERVFPGEGAFAVLAPTPGDGERPGYRCVTNQCPGSPEAVAERLEAAFGEAFHYRQARFLGQLAPVSVEVRPDARDWYVGQLLGRGMRWGDIKYSAILRPPHDTGCGWRLLRPVNGQIAEAPPCCAGSQWP
ncbi:MAG: GH3 auxin-responsive promoter family protein [Gemmatimonadales bacterium]